MPLFRCGGIAADRARAAEPQMSVPGAPSGRCRTAADLARPAQAGADAEHRRRADLAARTSSHGSGEAADGTRRWNDADGSAPDPRVQDGPGERVEQLRAAVGPRPPPPHGPTGLAPAPLGQGPALPRLIA
ncbi:hypothetical protein ACWCPF_31710 [Streptomyces sp. NPDC001858]